MRFDLLKGKSPDTSPLIVIGMILSIIWPISIVALIVWFFMNYQFDLSFLNGIIKPR